MKEQWKTETSSTPASGDGGRNEDSGNTKASTGQKWFCGHGRQRQTLICHAKKKKKNSNCINFMQIVELHFVS